MFHVLVVTFGTCCGAWLTSMHHFTTSREGEGLSGLEGGAVVELG